jgi:hypothetical protein
MNDNQSPRKPYKTKKKKKEPLIPSSLLVYPSIHRRSDPTQTPETTPFCLKSKNKKRTGR